MRMHRVPRRAFRHQPSLNDIENERLLPRRRRANAQPLRICGAAEEIAYDGSRIGVITHAPRGDCRCAVWPFACTWSAITVRDGEIRDRRTEENPDHGLA